MIEQEEIIRMAQEAGFAEGVAEIVGLEGFERFAALVTAHEREKQAEQEPAGYFTYDGDYNIWEEVFSKDTYGAVPLYATPVQQVDLTDDEIYPLYNEPTSDKEAIEFARAVIAADREKNK